MIPSANKKVKDLYVQDFEAILRYFGLLKADQVLNIVVKPLTKPKKKATVKRQSKKRR